MDLEDKKIYLKAKDSFLKLNEVRVPGKKSVDALCYFKSNKKFWFIDS